jgi:FAD dependent oxidoreductase
MTMRDVQTEIAIIGSSLGGVMAAWQACRAGRRVVLATQYHWLGGQMTSQGVPPDEHRVIERGGASESYLAFRRAIRDHYLRQADFIDRTEMTEGINPGDGWVSRLCFEPQVATDYFEKLLMPYVQNGHLVLFRESKISQVLRSERRIASVSLIDSEHAAIRISASMFIDATDTGELIKQAGLAYRLGKESRDDFSEADAPPAANRHDQQPVTYVMALRRHATPGKPIAEPDQYQRWKSYVVPHYTHRLFSQSMPGSQRGESAVLPLFAEGAFTKNTTLDWWRYRRIVSQRNWRKEIEEVSLINWAQNDYALQPLLDGAAPEDVVAENAKALSQCFLYWLQTAAPRQDGAGAGYPELQLATDMLGTTDGFAQQVYVRESRRIVGITTLTQHDIIDRDGKSSPVNLDDSVGISWYNMDIHPTCISGHGVNARVRPFSLPIGVFVPFDCDNLVPASKNISVTHLVNAATRVHPIEWLIGEVTGLLASTVISTGQSLHNIATTHDGRKHFQSRLIDAGIPIQWNADILSGTSQSAEH